MTDKHDTQKDDGADAPVVPESAQFIEESTLIPPSSLNVEGDLSGESVQVIGESSAEPEIPTANAKPVKAKGDGKKFPLPLIAAGAAGVLFIGIVGVKLMGAMGSQQPAAPVAQISQTKQVVKPVAPPPKVEVPTVQPPPIAPTPVDSTPVTPVTPPITPVAPPPVVVPEVPVVKAANDAEIRSIDSRTTSNTAEIVDLKQRVSALEQKPGAAAGTASGALATDTKAAVAKPKVRKLTAAEREAFLQKRAEKEVRRQEQAEREAKITRAASGYTVHAVKGNLAWLADSNGKVQPYNIGDTVAGVGKLSKVNERTHSVTAGGRVIR